MTDLQEVAAKVAALGHGPESFNERLRLEQEAKASLLDSGAASDRAEAGRIFDAAVRKHREEQLRDRDAAARADIADAEATLGSGAFVATIQKGPKGPVLAPVCDTSAWRAGTRTSDNRRGDRVIPAKGCRLPVGTKVYAVRDREIAKGVVVCRVQPATP